MVLGYETAKADQKPHNVYTFLGRGGGGVIKYVNPYVPSQTPEEDLSGHLQTLG